MTRRINFCDVVTVNDGYCPKDKFLYVVGAVDIDDNFNKKMEGKWELQEMDSEKRYKTFGCFITVWKPIKPPKDEK
jgi:hypothetical protein